jgi:tryptophanase
MLKHNVLTFITEKIHKHDHVLMMRKTACRANSSCTIVTSENAITDVGNVLSGHAMKAQGKCSYGSMRYQLWH